MPAANIFTLGIAPQSAKGTPASAPAILTKATGSNLMPNRETARIDETGTGRDGGDRYTNRIAAGGSINVVARPKIAAYILYGTLGIKEVVGSGAPYEWTMRPANDQPYWTIWRNLGGASLVERFEDVKFVSCSVQGSAGGLIMLNTNVAGTKTTRLTSMPVGGTLETDFPYRVPGADYEVGGSRNRAITEFNLTINVPMTAIQTDQIYDSFIEPGLRTIELTFTEVFQNLNLYNEVLYGTTTGTTLEEETIHKTWDATFGDITLGPGLAFSIPNLAYLQAPLEPNPGGDPLRMAVSGAADPTSDDSDIIQATVVNSLATI